MFSLDSKTSRRAWTGFAVAAVLTSFAGVSAFPAAAAEPLAPAITNPIEGMVFHDLPYIDGTGEPGSTAAITDGAGTPICAAPIDDFGNFSCAGTQRLPAGSNELTVTSTSSGGAQTVGNTVQVWGEYFPNVSSPAPGTLVSSGQAFSGHALPGVQVQLETATGNPVCTTVADEWGSFQCVPTVALPTGPLTLIPSMTTTGGETVLGESVAWTVIAQPVITSPVAGSVVGPLVTFAGTGHPGADLSILHAYSGAVLCSSHVTAEGTFSCTMTQPFLGSLMAVLPMLSLEGLGTVMGQPVSLTLQSAPVSPTSNPAPSATVPAVPTTTTPAATQTTGAAVIPSDRSGSATVLAATGVSGSGIVLVLSGLLLLGGAIALVPGLRRRTRH